MFQVQKNKLTGEDDAQKAVDYITNVFADAIPKLMLKFVRTV